jgi:hypothetical protein
MTTSGAPPPHLAVVSRCCRSSTTSIDGALIDAALTDRGRMDGGRTLVSPVFEALRLRHVR